MLRPPARAPEVLASRWPFVQAVSGASISTTRRDASDTPRRGVPGFGRFGERRLTDGDVDLGGSYCDVRTFSAIVCAIVLAGASSLLLMVTFASSMALAEQTRSVAIP